MNCYTVLRMAYLVFKADLKARKQSHLFRNYYQCRNICEQCKAVNPGRAMGDRFTYKNMRPGAPYAATCINHQEYCRTATRISPWSSVVGWQVENTSWDWMHLVYLGVAQSHVASCIKMIQLLGCGFDANETDDLYLKRTSIEMRQTCKSFGHLDLETLHVLISSLLRF